ncbi:TonB-dependent receptor plug domain-containing protein [Ketogulonicigenium vulgare]|uniref:TonB-dependent receptor plug domain-containing protein n=1 Tax=Ketogulonicigenium vulgare TaxID=92945 RepID=UPI002359CDE6|nr:TonB-dependent receptor [Ketogulonicigenium vulgare]
MKALTTISTLALIAMTGAASAQTDLGTIIILSGPMPVEANRTGALPYVVADATAGGQRALSDVLQTIPGFNLTRSGGYGQQSGFNLRGASQKYVPVYIDGIEVTDPSGTQVAFDFASLTTGGLSRIEVLPGSQSALFGARAVGGVINIQSARATEDGTHYSLDAEYGSHNTRALTFGVTHRDDRLSTAVTLTHLATDGISAAAAGTEDDGAETNRLSFNVEYALQEGAVIGASGFAGRSSANYDDFGPVDADNLSKSETQGLRLYTGFSAFGLDQELSYSHFNIERANHEAWSDIFYTGTRDRLAWVASTAIGAAGDISFGIDHSREDYTQSGTYGDSEGKTDITGAFAELRYAPIQTLDISASLRHDDHSDFGSFNSARLAAAWRFAPDWTLRGQIGNGFRAPSNYELHGPFGNAGLEPETSTSTEIGAEYALAYGGFIRATLFDLKIEDLIGFGTSSYEQVAGETHRQGAVLEAELPLSQGLRALASYTYTDSDPADTTHVGQQIMLGFAAQFTDLTTGRFDVTHVADRTSLPDYTVANAALTHALTPAITASLRVENLFDADYQLVSGYATSGRAVYAGLGARF